MLPVRGRFPQGRGGRRRSFTLPPLRRYCVHQSILQALHYLSASTTTQESSFICSDAFLYYIFLQANGLVNSLIELQRIGSIGLVVVDEVRT